MSPQGDSRAAFPLTKFNRTFTPDAYHDYLSPENTMPTSLQARLGILLSALFLLLAGCASTIQSEVTAFHEWPAEVSDKSFAFERTREQENNLELRAYENLVRGELLRLGFREAPEARARLKVALRYGITVRDLRVIEPILVDAGYGWPWYGPRWHRYGAFNPYYDPFWPGTPVVQQVESRYQVYTRQLQLWIAQKADGKKLFDVTVKSEGSNGSLAAVMPYLVHSAFSEFPGRNGVPRVVTLKMKE
jgi:hypothetical protein